jgi:predicted Zn-dependent peptidase
MTVLRLTLTELFKLTTMEEPINDEELWKAKMQIRGEHIIAAEDTYTRMSRLASQEFYFGRHLPSDEILAQVEAVDSCMLQNLANEVLVDALRQATVAIVGPDSPKDYRASRVEELLTGLQYPS